MIDLNEKELQAIHDALKYAYKLMPIEDMESFISAQSEIEEALEKAKEVSHFSKTFMGFAPKSED